MATITGILTPLKDKTFGGGTVFRAGTPYQVEIFPCSFESCDAREECSKVMKGLPAIFSASVNVDGSWIPMQGCPLNCEFEPDATNPILMGKEFEPAAPITIGGIEVKEDESRSKGPVTDLDDIIY